MSITKRIEEHYGDLDEHFDQDGMAGLQVKFVYSKADADAGTPNPTDIPIRGNVASGSSNFRSGINSYKRFREAANGSAAGSSKPMDTEDEPPFSWALAALKERYGEPMARTEKMASFQLSDGRQLVLDLEAERTKIWLEGKAPS
jgi:hypothetical protein